MGVDMALHEKGRLLRVYAARQQRCRHFARIGDHGVGILDSDERMQVDDAIDALIIILQLYPIADCSQIVAELDAMGGLDARKDTAVHGSLANC